MVRGFIFSCVALCVLAGPVWAQESATTQLQNNLATSSFNSGAGSSPSFGGGFSGGGQNQPNLPIAGGGQKSPGIIVPDQGQVTQNLPIAGGGGHSSGVSGHGHVFTASPIGAMSKETFDLNHGGIVSESTIGPGVESLTSFSVQPSLPQQNSLTGLPVPSVPYTGGQSGPDFYDQIYALDSGVDGNSVVAPPEMSSQQALLEQANLSQSEANSITQKLNAVEEVQAAQQQAMQAAQAMVGLLPPQLQQSYANKMNQAFSGEAMDAALLKGVITTYEPDQIGDVMQVLDNPDSEAAKTKLYQKVSKDNPKVKTLVREAERQQIEPEEIDPQQAAEQAVNSFLGN